MNAATPSSQKVRVGIVGVGNCASAFVQGLTYYRNAPANEPIDGLMNPNCGGYLVGDIDVSAAFDVSAHKVGLDVAEAVFARPNNADRFAEVGPLGVRVERGPTFDGIGRYMADEITESSAPAIDVSRVLQQTRTNVLVSYLPVGSREATEHYAACALEAGCAFVNCVPVFIASDRSWRRRFEERELPLIGDDVKSQVGATIVHRVLAQLLRDRGVRLDRTYQLNFGGNADFKNMLERERLVTKKISKTTAVTSRLDGPIPDTDIHIGPSDHVPWLGDHKVAYIRLEGSGFGRAPIAIELKLEVYDSPNSAGVVIDAVRCAKIALDRRIGGALVGPCSFYMKSPPVQFDDNEAREKVMQFVLGDRTRGSA